MFADPFLEFGLISAIPLVMAITTSTRKTATTRQSVWVKAWYFFRWMLLGLAIAGLLVWAGVGIGSGIWQTICFGGAIVIMVGIGLWVNAMQGEIYRRSAPMNVPFVGKAEEPALAKWGTKEGFVPQGDHPTYRTPGDGSAR
jgi:hypothetical protein